MTALLKLAIGIGSACLWMGASHAQTLSTASLPSFARNPAAFTSNSQVVWKELGDSAQFYSFTNSGVAAWGGTVSYSGYRQKLGNNFYLDMRTGSGFEPSFFQRNSFAGTEFATSQFRLGYSMGRLQPFIGVSASVANPIAAAGAPGGLNLLPQQQFQTRSFTSVTAGFNYAVTDKLSFGVGVSVGAGDRMLSPLAAPGLQ